MKPLVSIIVPVFNVEKYLGRCVDSLIRQSLENIEIILVDDGSEDSSPLICEQYCRKDPRVKMLHKDNAGLGMARNTGIEAAEGEFLAFIDSDDYVKAEMFYDLYECAVQNGADAVISGGFFSVKQTGKITIDRETEHQVMYDGNTRQLALEMMGAPPSSQRDSVYEMSACKGIYRSEVIRSGKIRFLSERTMISEDLVFHFDFFQAAKKAVILPQIYYYYCERPASLSRQYRKDRFLRNLDFYRYMESVLRKYRYEPADRLYAQRMLLSRARTTISQIAAQYPLTDRQAKGEIVDVCSAAELQEILHRYPIDRLPYRQKIFSHLMKAGNWFLLYLLSFANSIRKRVMS